MNETGAPFTFEDFHAELGEAEAALRAFAQGPAREAAETVSDAFDRAGGRIAGALARAGADGAVSMKELARTILQELAKLAVERLFASTPASADFFGARANGGTVNRGGAYLVGERGPELFTPHASGMISAPASGPVSVHFHLGAGADASGLARHQGQIAASVARAVAYGRRNL